jgi:hypothetical protein
MRMNLSVEDATPEELLKAASARPEKPLSKAEKELLGEIDNLREKLGENIPVEDVHITKPNSKKVLASLLRKGVLFEPHPGFISRLK